MLPEEELFLLGDPQTSGGLLLFAPEERAGALEQTLRSEGEGAWAIGRTGEMTDAAMPRVTVV
jgi:selenophosphate synthase